MIDKSSSSKLLRIIASAIEGFTNEEIERLLSGESKLLVTPSVSRSTKREPAQVQELEDVIRGLNDAKDRDEARAVLARIANKKSLTAVAKSQKLHITKQDRREDIENKIVEFYIGAKLRSDAIKTLNMKGGGDG